MCSLICVNSALDKKEDFIKKCFFFLLLFKLLRRSLLEVIYIVPSRFPTVGGVVQGICSILMHIVQ